MDGKFFSAGNSRFPVKGVSYGPFAPHAQGHAFLSSEQTASDFTQIQELGANVVRVYNVPPRWMLDLASSHNLRLLVGIPWNHHLCFLDSKAERQKAIDTVKKAVAACGRHPAVFAFCIANEIAPDVVRWSGAHRVEQFLDELAVAARRIDPGCLCTFANYPPTEFLRPQEMDFTSFNVYLHEQQPFENYLARLQMIADTKPLLLTEFGIDSIREGEERQSEILGWSIESAFKGGLAGTVIFSFTDEWHRDGELVEDWNMGITTRDRQPRPAFSTVQKAYQSKSPRPLQSAPKVSVVVASYNGATTLRACLESLEQLNYPDYEVILVDDGSTDNTPELIKPRADGSTAFPHLQSIRHDKNAGLSAARNTGIAAATGEIVAFTDADCRVDQDWLHFLVGTLDHSDFAGVGGPNLLPPDDSAVAAAVMASPGGPAHVMMDDREAEHIPGCNMAFYKSALESIGGFDPMFTKAGDDVDLCWRLQQAGFHIGFNPAAFVWHYRRSTISAYLKQQEGYGEAEALLVRKHPEYFSSLGGSVWRGRIYGASKQGVQLRSSIVYHGTYGSGWFQTLYAAAPTGTLMLATTLEYHVFITLPLLVLSAVWIGLFPLAIAALALPLMLSGLAAAQATLPGHKKRWWSRPLVAFLFFVQPIARGWARHRGRLVLPGRIQSTGESLDSLSLLSSDASLNEAAYWSSSGVDRLNLLGQLIQRLNEAQWPNRADIGWSDYDVEIQGNRWSSVQLTTALEPHPKGRQLFRCKFKARWTLLSKMLFWMLLGIDLLIIGFFEQARAWNWIFLLLLPALFWFLRRQGKDLQSRCMAFVDTMAREIDLTKLGDDPAPSPPIATATASSELQQSGERV